jgi:hypothetical protein
MGQKKLSERQKRFEQLREQCRLLMSDGMSSAEIAKKLGVARTFVVKWTVGVKRKPRKNVGVFAKVYNEWLDKDDEANRFKFWVPSPNEIKAGCAEIKSQFIPEWMKRIK